MQLYMYSLVGKEKKRKSTQMYFKNAFIIFGGKGRLLLKMRHFLYKLYRNKIKY